MREDLLVSVCFADMPSDLAAFDMVASLASTLDERFRYREIVVVVEESRRDSYLPLVRRVRNLRLFTVRVGTPFYRRRVIAVDEAIGDIVLIANLSELTHLDFVHMIEQAADEQVAVLGARAPGFVDRTLAAPLNWLGRVAGFKVDLRDLQSLALPRTLLNQLLTHPDPELALRFPPRDVRVPLRFAEAAPEISARHEPGQLGRRLELVQKLMVYVAPRLLMAVTLASALLAGTGVLYALYVLSAWILIDDLAPGWLTLSAVLSTTAFFLGVTIMGLSLGLQQLLARTGRETFDGVVSEVNQVDLFDQVASDLNVDLGLDGSKPPRPGLDD